MPRSIAGVALIGFIISACAGMPRLPGTVEEPCAQHADPQQCQAALDAARPELNADPERYEISVGSITCDESGCTTWVTAAPRPELADCLPIGDVEVARGPDGSWSVLSIAHGDPPCAFEP